MATSGIRHRKRLIDSFHPSPYSVVGRRGGGREEASNRKKPLGEVAADGPDARVRAFLHHCLLNTCCVLSPPHIMADAKESLTCRDTVSTRGGESHTLKYCDYYGQELSRYPQPQGRVEHNQGERVVLEPRSADGRAQCRGTRKRQPEAGRVARGQSCRPPE